KGGTSANEGHPVVIGLQFAYSLSRGGLHHFQDLGTDGHAQTGCGIPARYCRVVRRLASEDVDVALGDIPADVWIRVERRVDEPDGLTLRLVEAQDETRAQGPDGARAAAGRERTGNATRGVRRTPRSR